MFSAVLTICSWTTVLSSLPHWAFGLLARIDLGQAEMAHKKQGGQE